MPEDSPIELLVMEGEDFVSVPGRQEGPGEYVFPDVPQAPYYVKVGRNHVLTDARDVDLSADVPARTGVEYPDGGAVMRVVMWNFEPWSGRSEPSEPSPELHFVSEEVGYGHWPMIRLNGRDDGAEKFVTESELPRFEQARGDRAWVTQLSPRVLGRRPDGSTQHYLTASRALHLPPLSYAHDRPSMLLVQGELGELPTSELELDWRATEFASAASEVHPAATLIANSFRLSRIPAAPSVSWSSNFQLLRLSVPPSNLYDVWGTLTYGNPEASPETVAGSAVMTFSVTFEPPDEPPLVVAASVSTHGRLSQLTAGPVRPGVLPPRGLAVDGTEAYSSRTLAAGSHVISWQPPSQGTPDAYVLSVLSPLREGEPLTLNPSAFFYLDGGTTSVRLPSRLMQPGRRYYFVVDAVRAEGYAVSDKPLTLYQRLSLSRASALSGLFTIPAQTP